MGAYPNATNVSNSAGNGYIASDGCVGPPNAALGASPEYGAAAFPFGSAGSINAAVTAYAAGGQANATPLTKQYNFITTNAAADGSVLLPETYGAGLDIWITNTTANAAEIYPYTGGTINGGSANAGVVLAAGATAHLVSIAANTWYGPEDLT